MADKLQGFNPKSEITPSFGERNVSDISYLTILQNLQRFRASARADHDYYDFPGHVYFKILFHFNNGSDADLPGTPGTNGSMSTDQEWEAMSGLIAPSWTLWNPESFSDAYTLAQQDITNLWQHSTAWNYFVMNDDKYRADCVANFIQLLSNINTYTPWYFRKINGIENAIKRDLVNFSGESNFSIKTEKQKITIECMEDSYDQRIGTLLDLYRSFVWSWETKREMLPANLRKFDMTIIQFQIPLMGTHTNNNAPKLKEDDWSKWRAKEIITDSDNGFAVIYADGTKKMASFKAWEFHGCEIDYNSGTDGQVLDNMEGGKNSYNIDVFFDDCMEIRWNEFAGLLITDMKDDLDLVTVGGNLEAGISGQTEQVVEGNNQASPLYKESRNRGPVSGLNKNLDGGEAHGITRKSTLLGQLLSPLKQKVTTAVNKVVLGNLHGFSLNRVGQQVGQLTSGNLWATVNNVKGYVEGKTTKIGNIFEGNELGNLSMKSLGKTLTNS